MVALGVRIGLAMFCIAPALPAVVYCMMNVQMPLPGSLSESSHPTLTHPRINTHQAGTNLPISLSLHDAPLNTSSDYNRLPHYNRVSSGTNFMTSSESPCVSPWICEPLTHISRIDFFLFSLTHHSSCKIQVNVSSTVPHASCHHTVSLTFLHNLRHLGIPLW